MTTRLRISNWFSKIKFERDKKRSKMIDNTCFHEIFSEFIAYRCSIKPHCFSMYKQFMKEFSYFSKEKYAIDILNCNRDNLNNYLKIKYTDVFIYDDYIFGIRIWY